MHCNAYKVWANERCWRDMRFERCKSSKYVCGRGSARPRTLLGELTALTQTQAELRKEREGKGREEQRRGEGATTLAGCMKTRHCIRHYAWPWRQETPTWATSTQGFTDWRLETDMEAGVHCRWCTDYIQWPQAVDGCTTVGRSSDPVIDRLKCVVDCRCRLPLLGRTFVYLQRTLSRSSCETLSGCVLGNVASIYWTLPWRTTYSMSWAALRKTELNRIK